MASETDKRTRLGADAVGDAFVRHGIERIHVFPGGTIAPILNAAIERGIAIFTARHEQGGGYSALAGARLNGRPEVCMVTSGPGVTNLVTVVADAYFDSTPLVVITGQVGTGDMRGEYPVRQRGFQEVDTVALMRPITKEQIQPHHPDEVAEAVERAFRASVEGRPGPVLLDLPMDVQRGESSEAYEPPERAAAAPAIEAADIEQAAEWLAAAERPVIIAGQGVLLAQATEQLRALVESRSIPVSHSLLGLGSLPSNHPLSLGYHGHTGNQYAGMAIHNADLVLVLGSRLDVRQTGSVVDGFAPNARVVRVELDPPELDFSRIPSQLGILGDVGEALTALNGRLVGLAVKDLTPWHERVQNWKREFALSWEPSERLQPQPIIELADLLTADEDVVVVTGVGSHQHWVARHVTLDYPRRVLLTSGGHGAMGYDLPTAVGAAFARPDARVLCFVGDGSFQMNIQELASIVDQELPVKIIVLDNHRLGIVSQFQLFNWQDDPTCGDKWNPDFAAIAKAYGIPSWSVQTESEVEPALRAALDTVGPALVHCTIDPAADVVPMLMAGKTMDQMWPYAQ